MMQSIEQPKTNLITKFVIRVSIVADAYENWLIMFVSFCCLDVMTNVVLVRVIFEVGAADFTPKEKFHLVPGRKNCVVGVVFNCGEPFFKPFYDVGVVLGVVHWEVEFKNPVVVRVSVDCPVVVL